MSKKWTFVYGQERGGERIADGTYLLSVWFPARSSQDLLFGPVSTIQDGATLIIHAGCVDDGCASSNLRDVGGGWVMRF